MAINPTKLDQELREAGLDVISVRSDGTIFLADPTPENEATAADVLAAHDPTDYAAQQADEAAALADQIFGSLRQLEPQTAAYVAFAQLMAVEAGDDPAAITDEASAVAYIAGRADWQALPAALRGFLADMLRARAKIDAAILAALRR